MTREETLRALELATRLVYEGERVAFSGRSLSLILAQARDQLESVNDGTEGQLLDYWEEQLPKFRQLLLARATRVRRLDEGTEMPLVTENAAGTALAMCPPKPVYR